MACIDPNTEQYHFQSRMPRNKRLASYHRLEHCFTPFAAMVCQYTFLGRGVPLPWHIPDHGI